MWGQLVIDSVARPREAARQILALGVPEGQLMQAAVLVTCVGMLLGYLAVGMSPGEIDPVSAAVLGAPLIGAGIQLGIMAVVVVLTVRIGRMFGGQGGLWGALALVVWLNVMMVLIQAGQLVLLVLVPPLAALIAIATLLWAAWAFANFVAELHGFRNPVLVLSGAVVTVVVIVLGMTMLLWVLGITPPPEAS